MTPPQTTRVRYHLQLSGTAQQHLVLDADDVLAWVMGFATARGAQDALAVIQPGPEDTRRVQALQIGDAQGWFTYLYPEFPERTEG